MSMISHVGYGDVIPLNDKQRIITMLIMLLGDALFIICFGMMASLAMTQKKEDYSTSSFLELTANCQKIMKLYDVDDDTVIRLERFLAYKWSMNNQMGSLDFKVLNKYLPDSLTSQISLIYFKDFLDVVPFLQNLNIDFLRSISKQLKPVMYMPLDNIVCQGEWGQQMFFILHGVCHVIKNILKSENNQKKTILVSEAQIQEENWDMQSTVIAILQSGDFFGEFSILNKSIRKASVIAITYCSLYTLSKFDFDKVLADFPIYKKKMETFVDQKLLQKMRQKYGRKSSRTESPLRKDNKQNILSYNSRGHILKHQLEKLDEVIGNEQENITQSYLSIPYIFYSKNPLLFNKPIVKLMQSRKDIYSDNFEEKIIQREIDKIKNMKHRKIPKDESLQKRLSVASFSKHFILEKEDQFSAESLQDCS